MYIRIHYRSKFEIGIVTLNDAYTHWPLYWLTLLPKLMSHNFKVSAHCLFLGWVFNPLSLVQESAILLDIWSKLKEFKKERKKKSSFYTQMQSPFQQNVYELWFVLHLLKCHNQCLSTMDMFSSMNYYFMQIYVDWYILDERLTEFIGQ